eukprot:12510096-Alexandrium_andersonii.AAC.1
MSRSCGRPCKASSKLKKTTGRCKSARPDSVSSLPVQGGPSQQAKLASPSASNAKSEPIATPEPGRKASSNGARNEPVAECHIGPRLKRTSTGGSAEAASCCAARKCGKAYLQNSCWYRSLAGLELAVAFASPVAGAAPPELEDAAPVPPPPSAPTALLLRACPCEPWQSPPPLSALSICRMPGPGGPGPWSLSLSSESGSL